MTRPVPLKYLAHINRQALPEDTSPDSSFAYVDIGAVSDGEVVVPDIETTFKDAPSRARRVAPQGATIVSTVRTYLRAIARVPADSRPLVFSTGFAVLEASDEVDPRFLYYACRSNTFIDEVVARSTGVSYPAINASDLAAIKIPLMSLADQRRVADFLDVQVDLLDSAASLRREQRALVAEKEHAQLGQLIDEAFATGSIPLKRLSRGIEQGSSPQCDATPAEGDEWGVLKLSAVKRGRFKAEENKRIPDGVAPVEAYEVKDGDLLVTRANTPQLVGDVAVARDVPAHRQLCDLIYRVRLDDDVVPEFVAATLLSPRLRTLIPALARGSSASMIKLRGEDILGLPIPAVSPGQQRGLVAQHRVLSERNDRLVALLDESLGLLRERKQALITAAVSGAIDVTTARSAA